MIFRLSTGVALFAIYVLFFTRFGAFLVFDVVSDLQGSEASTATYADAPLHISQIINPSRTIGLPSQIHQVSGIYFSDDISAVSTDQAELFVIDDETGKILSKNVLFPWTPLLLRQGRLEALTQVDGSWWLAGEIKNFVTTSLSSTDREKRPMPPALVALEISGLANSGATLIATSADQVSLTVWDRSTSDISELELDFGHFAKNGRDIDFTWSGIAAAKGKLFITSDSYPIVVVADALSGTVEKVIGIPGVGGFSDISVRNDEIFLPKDHNLFDPRPPIGVYGL